MKLTDEILMHQSVTARATGLVKKTYTIEASPDVINRLDRFLEHVEYCAGVGHSTLVGMSIDGDGPDSFYVVAPKLTRDSKEERPSDSTHRVELP